MKRNLLTAAALIAMSCSSIFAAKTAEEIRIYLNPGHGSWGPNDRPMQTIGRQPYSSTNTDTTGFFESNTNLHKCFSLLDELVKAGVPFDRTKNQDNANPARVGAALDMSQHIVMSHVKAGPYPYTSGQADSEAYNRSLSEIREEVEANNFDIFISIHSNAASEGSSSNYPLYLFRGYDDERESAAGSKAMAQHIWPYSYGNAHQCWSNYSLTSSNVRGDVDFYGGGSATANGDKSYYGYLGVLKHGVPGFLVEGYFHTYQPARQRAMNDDVCRHEGHLYARGLIDYMGWKKETTGEIYGIVRDLHEKFSDPLYTPAARTDDQYKPLNGVAVKLYKDGQEVASYTTDNEYNGAFIFSGLEPGNYTLSYSAEGYKGATEEYLQPIEVAANETAYVNAFLESTDYVPPTVVYENYPDLVDGNKAFGVADEYNLTQVAEEAEPLKEQLADKTIRRQIVRNGNLYVLALDAANEPSIYCVNLSDNTVSTISTDGLTLDGNKDLKLSDIAFSADNVLVGCSYGENQFSNDQVAPGDTRGDVAIYKWANNENGVPTGNPEKWFTSQNSGNYYNAMTGQTIAVSGTVTDGSVVTTAQTIGSSTSMRFIEFGLADGNLATTTFINKEVSAESNYTATKLGADYRLTVSPLADNQYIIDGSNTTPLEWQTAGSNVDAPLMGRIGESLMNNAENGISCFKYAGHDFLVAPVVADGKSTGVKLLDITAGLDNAKLIVTNNTTADAAEATFVSAAGNIATTVDDNDVVKTATIELFLIRDGKISKYTTAGIDQPKVRGEYAYDLQAGVGKSSTSFSFKSTGDAARGTILVTNTETNETTMLPIEPINKGDNSLTVDNSELSIGTSTWEVAIEGKPIAQPTKLQEISGYPKARGLVIDNTPTSKFFGQIYVANCTADDSYEKGIYIYDRDLNRSEHAYGGDSYTASHTASPYRLGVNENGVVFVSDWNDPTSGIRMLDPANLSEDPKAALPELFKYTSRSGNGGLTNGDVYVGGSTTAAHIYGTGENTRLFTFDEDAGNVIFCYDLGTTLSWDKAPSLNLGHCKMDNTNVELLADDNGVWAVQTRGAGNNNTNVPSFVYVDMEGNILFNSGSIADVLSGTNGGGIAISKDNKTMIVADAASDYAVFSIEWNDKTPALTYQYTIASGMSTAVNQMAMDYAGNLYVLHQSGLQVWSLPTEHNTSVTPAAEAITIEKEGGIIGNGVSGSTVVYPNPATDVLYVKADSQIDNISIFNLSGSRIYAPYAADASQATVDTSELLPGVYVIQINNEKAIRFIKK